MKRALAFTLMVLAIMIIAVSCEEPQAHVHTYSEKWECDENYHWHEATCEHTDEKGDKAKHTWGDWVVDEKATETKEGSRHHVCTVCNYEAKETIPVVGHVHTPSSSYKSDDDGHWQLCSGCGNKLSYSSHSLEYESTGDLYHRQRCTVCDYKTAEEEHSIATITHSDGKKEQFCEVCNKYTKTLAAVETITGEVKSVTAVDTTATGTSKITVVENGKETTKTVDNNKIVKNNEIVTIETKVVATETSDTSSSSSTTKDEEKTTVSFPKNGLKMEEGATYVTLTVKAVSAVEATSSSSGYQVTTTEKLSEDQAKRTVTTDEAVAAVLEFDLKGAVASDLTGTKTENGKTESVGTTVTTFISKGLQTNNSAQLADVIEIKYLGNTSGKDPELVSYDNDSGKLVFTIYHFSSYAVVAKNVVATDNKGNMYASLEAAMSGDTKNRTVTLLRNITLDKTISFDKTVTIDLNGKTIAFDGTKVTNAINNSGTLTLKNGTIEYSKTSDTWGFAIISNEGTLNTENLTVQATVKTGCHISVNEETLSAVISNHNSCPSIYLVMNTGTAAFNKSTLSLEVALNGNKLIDSGCFAGIKPILIYQKQGSSSDSSTIIKENSKLIASTGVSGGVLGLYIEVDSGASYAATAEISNSTVEVTNSCIGWSRPVFADGRDSSELIKIEITGSSTIKSTDTLSKATLSKELSSTALSEKVKTKTNRVYGLRAKGNSIIEIGSGTNVVVSTPDDSEAEKHQYATDVEDNEGSAKESKICGQILNTSTDTWYIDTKEGLITALDKANAGATVKLCGDVELDLSEMKEGEPALTIDKSLTIDGDNHTIYNEDNVTNTNVKMLTVKDLAQNDCVTLKNLTLESKTYCKYMRGLQVQDSKKAKVTLENVTISLPHYYAIYLIDTDYLTLCIEKCNIQGWTTLYNHDSNVTVIAKDTELVSISPVSGGGSSNSFSGIVVSEYYGLNKPSEKNTMTFTECNFIASISTDATKDNVKQQIADLRSPCENTLVLDNCEFTPAEGSQYFVSCYDSSYENNVIPENKKGTNKILVDNENINFSEKVTWYLDANKDDGANLYHVEYKNIEDASLTDGNSYTYWYYRYEKTENDTSVTLPNLTKSGYTFGGWYTDKQFEESSKKTEIAKSDAEHFTLYAKWTSNDSI